MQVTDIVCCLQVKLQAANMFLMAQKPVPGSNEQVLYITAAVRTAPALTQLLLEVSMHGTSAWLVLDLTGIWTCQT
jgi:hypothetical protein